MTEARPPQDEGSSWGDEETYSAAPHPLDEDPAENLESPLPSWGRQKIWIAAALISVTCGLLMGLTVGRQHSVGGAIGMTLAVSVLLFPLMVALLNQDFSERLGGSWTLGRVSPSTDSAASSEASAANPAARGSPPKNASSENASPDVGPVTPRAAVGFYRPPPTAEQTLSVRQSLLLLLCAGILMLMLMLMVAPFFCWVIVAMLAAV